MGRLVQLLGTGVGLAAEAVQHHRDKSGERSAQASTPAAPPSTSLPTALPARGPESRWASRQVPDGAPPAYAEAPDEVEDNSDSDDDSELADDEAAWELDEMAQRVAPSSYEQSEAALEAEAEAASQQPEEVKEKKEVDMIRDLVRMAGPPPQPVPRLEAPVIIPQRRPRKKDRGFVRAYAPVLADSGISQELFLTFLQDWHIASKASPWIDVVFIAAAIAGNVPKLEAQVLSAVIQVTVGTYRELQTRHRRNTFLDKANEQLFMPRGLYAMVMAFKDEVPGQQTGGPLSRLASKLGGALFTAERLDINQTAAKYANPDPNMSKMKQKMKSVRLTSGKTHGEAELLQAAALVYPALDKAAEQDLEAEGKGEAAEGSTKNKWKSAGKFVQEYLDRRAQATYETQHPGSALAVPSSTQAPFLTRLGDPNQPASSGSLISLLTGGAINPAGRRRERKAARQERREGRREYGDAQRVARGRSARGPPRRLPRVGQRKRILQQDVLYLIIVNLPTPAEVAQSVAMLEEAVAKEPN